MGHDGFGLVVKHQVDSRKGGIAKECRCQATEEAPVALTAVDAPQGCVDALIAVPPALPRKHRTGARTVALGVSTEANVRVGGITRARGPWLTHGLA